MNAAISVFVICVKAITYLYDCTFQVDKSFVYVLAEGM